jgi:glycosyltransferase involved in cell wall biosynthesis
MIYNNYNELVDKINIILKNENLLNKIAENGYQLSFRHTYDERSKLLIDFLKGAI